MGYSESTVEKQSIFSQKNQEIKRGTSWGILARIAVL
jgi:hypothetical protein